MKKIKYKHLEKMTVKFGSLTVGTLTHTADGPFFSYTDSWINNGIELSPLNWPLRAEEYPPSISHSDGKLPGFIADSLPDTFGKQIMLSYFEEKGLIDPNPLDLLAIVGNRGTGALTYHPEDKDFIESSQSVISEIKLGRLAREAGDVIAKLNDGKISNILLRNASSIGGARPKMRIFIADDNRFYGIAATKNKKLKGDHYILKFDQNNEGWGKIEYAYAQLAKDSGISVPDCRIVKAVREDGAELFNFAIKRFDIVDGKRLHYHSAAGYYNRSINPFLVQGDYAELADALNQLGTFASDKEELLRRCVFNILTHNLDDHFKNFGFCISEDGRWSLSPAFDLCYTEPGQAWLTPYGRCTKVMGHSRDVIKKDVFEFASFSGIRKTQVIAIIEQIQSQTEEWLKYAEENSIHEKLAVKIDSVMKSTSEKFHAKK